MQREQPTLYHRLAADRLELLPACGAHANVQRITRWAHAIPEDEFRALTVPAAGNEARAVDPKPFVSDVLRTMRREIGMRSNIYGLTFVLLGLAVPVEVYEMQTSYAATTIKFLARSAPDAPLRMSVEFEGATMEPREVDLLRMLAPALAAYAVDPTRAPRVPAAMLEVARSVPYGDTTGGIDVAMVRARQALTGTGFPPPCMDGVSVWTDSISLEDWLQRTATSLSTLAELDDRITQTLETLRRDVDAYRTMLARCMALGADALP